MTPQEQIDRGRKLTLLTQDENFSPLKDYINERLNLLSAQTEAWDESAMSPAGCLTRLVHRRRELADLLEWIDDEIERGQSAHLKRDKEKA